MPPLCRIGVGRDRCDARAVTSAEADDRVLPLTRAVSWFIVPFLLVGFVVLWPVPTDTGALFAWQVMPTLTAMILGAAYLGGAYFFVRAGRAAHWHTIKGGFVPVTTFATLLGIATVIHWDRFHHRHVAFWLWAGLYFTTPFLVAFVYLRNRRHDAPAVDSELRLPAATARVIGGVGALALITGLLLYVVPGTAIRYWPWHLTPLTARVMGAIFCLGLSGIGAFVDQRWTSARIPLQVAAVMLVLILVAGVRAHAELAGGNILTWAFVAGFGLLAVATVMLYVRMERLSRA
jgi:hypothetical protein